MEGSLRDTVLGLKKKIKKVEAESGHFCRRLRRSGSGIPRPRNPVRDVVRCGAGAGLVTQPALRSEGRRCDEAGSRVCSRCDAAGLFLSAPLVVDCEKCAECEAVNWRKLFPRLQP